MLLLLRHYFVMFLLPLATRSVYCHLSFYTAAMIPSSLRDCFQKTVFRVMLSTAPLTLAPLNLHAYYAWQFDTVQNTDPLIFFGDKTLRHPRLLGSGGGGAVFALTNDSDGKSYAVKTSWASSAESIANECRVLQRLEHIAGVERCLGMQSYVDETGSRRVMILLEPVMEGPIAASLSELSHQLQPHAIEMLVKVMIQILAANVAVTDVQILISQKTGDVLFIDFSEARVLSSAGTFIEQALLSNFVQEVSTLIPEHQMEFASAVVSRYLEERKSEGVPLRDEALALLQNQFLDR